MNSSTNRIGGKDLINIGIFTAIIFAITMCVMPLGFIVVLMPLYTALIPLIGGVPFMLFMTKVKKPGMIMIMSILLSILLMLTGMGWYALPICILGGTIAELLVKKGEYKSVRLQIAAHGFFCIWVFGSYIPLIFMADTYWTDKTDFGEEYINQAKNLFQYWMAPALIISCIVFGLLGGWLGAKMLKKHFVKAGIV